MHWIALDGPMHPLFKVFANRVVNEINFREFECYITGGLLEDWVSWDIDIVITGPKDLEFARYLMERIFEIGIQMGLYVDMKFMLESDWPLKFREHYLQEPKTYTSYELACNFTRDGQVQNQDDYIIEGPLYKKMIQFPFQKQLQNYETHGYIYKDPVNIRELI